MDGFVLFKLEEESGRKSTKRVKTSKQPSSLHRCLHADDPDDSGYEEFPGGLEQLANQESKGPSSVSTITVAADRNICEPKCWEPPHHLFPDAQVNDASVTWSVLGTAEATRLTSRAGSHSRTTTLGVVPEQRRPQVPVHYGLSPVSGWLW